MAEWPIAPDCRSAKSGVQIPLLPPNPNKYKIYNNMKFKTWEKVYWGIISVLIVINLIGTLFKEGDIPVPVGDETKLVSKAAYVGYLLLGCAIIFVPIWLVVRWIVNRSDDKERERK